MIEHVVFFLEEPSAQDFLECLLPQVLPAHITPHFLVFEGKQDLEKRLPMRMKGWLRPNTRFIVMRDQDSDDCMVVKKRLQMLCGQAGHPESVVRIVCRELETFFVGDWPAVATAYQRPTWADYAHQAKYRHPDRLGSPSAELKRLIPTYQKRAGARRISAHLRLEADHNQSKSFQVLIRTLQALCHA
jgi:hypothetical protein